MAGINKTAPALICLLLLSAGCAIRGNPLDPSDADGRLALSDEEPDGYGSPIAYEHAARAELYMSVDNPGAAVDELKKALKADPDDNYLRAGLAFALMGAGDSKRAKRQIEKALRADPSHEYAWLALAEYKRAQGDKAGAQGAAMRAMRVEPESPAAAMWLSEFYRETGDEKRRAEILRRLVLADPLNAEARLGLGEASLKLGEKAEAVRQLTEFAALRPMRSGEVAKLASIEIDKGDSFLRAELLTIAVSKGALGADVQMKLIEALLDAGLERRARERLDSLPPLEPDDMEAAVKRACLLCRTNRPYEARALLAPILESGEKTPREILAVAEVEALLGRIEEARMLLAGSNGKWSAEELESKNRFLEELAANKGVSPQCGFRDR